MLTTSQYNSIELTKRLCSGVLERNRCVVDQYTADYDKWNDVNTIQNGRLSKLHNVLRVGCILSFTRMCTYSMPPKSALMLWQNARTEDFTEISSCRISTSLVVVFTSFKAILPFLYRNIFMKQNLFFSSWTSNNKTVAARNIILKMTSRKSRK